MKLLKIILAFSLPLFLILGCKKSDDSSTSSTTSTTSTASCTADTTSTTLTASSSCLDGFYTHPKEADFTDFKISSPLPTCFTDEYARRKDMGDQYLQILGSVSIVGESSEQICDITRVGHALFGFVDSDADGKVDDENLWNTYAPSLNSKDNRLVLYVAKEKQNYKKFDSDSPSVYSQAFSTASNGEVLKFRTVLEELFHFLQNVLWRVYYKTNFGFEENPASIVDAAAAKALQDKHYVYDPDCTSTKSCLVTEFFFCVMTDLMTGWPDSTVPANTEWTLKGQTTTIQTEYKDMVEMVTTRQNNGTMPKKWPGG
ncbi:MAG: hypothetical protein MK510_13760 [SAR324 cluster bacterium]|nr:hypothetical protein [SAR324 cluster bacterium]